MLLRSKLLRGKFLQSKFLQSNVIGILSVLVGASCAYGQAIDFETLPGGTPTVDQQSISTQYEAEFGVSFDLVDPVTLVSVGSPVIAKVGAPQTAFVGCGPDTPLEGEGIGDSFLTDDDAINNQAGTLLLTYTDPVAQAAGAVLDVDRRTGSVFEEWTIEALDAAMGVIDTVILTAPGGTSACGGSAGSGDARAMGFFFDHATSDIHFILIRYTGNAGSIGLAFDNFTPTTIPPAPTAVASATIDDPCFGDAIEITAMPTDGLPGFQYQWQQAPPLGSFTDIEGETNQTFIAPAFTDGISYRAVVTDALFRQTITNAISVDAGRALAWALKVETAAGSGVFTTLTTNIVPYVFDESLSTVYDWQSSEQYYHGAEPILQLDRSHMFMVVAPGGQSLVVVNDSADPNTGGRSEMRADFVGVTPEYSFKDDPTFDQYQGGGTSTFETRHIWGAPNTDGWAAGPLSGSWSAAVQFTDGFSGGPTIEGLTEWYFHSADGTAYELPLEVDRIVVIESICSCPADLNSDGELNFFDVSEFLQAFGANDLAADFTGDGILNFFDVSAFLAAFASGCP